MGLERRSYHRKPHWDSAKGRVISVRISRDLYQSLRYRALLANIMLGAYTRQVLEKQLSKPHPKEWSRFRWYRSAKDKEMVVSMRLPEDVYISLLSRASKKKDKVSVYARLLLMVGDRDRWL